MSKKIVQVIPLMRLKRDLQYFDYAVPPELHAQIKPGQLVEIPFRNKIIKGVVLNLADSSKLENEQLKSLEKIVDPLPLLADWQMQLIKDLSAYYFVSPAMIAKMLVPEIPKKVTASRKKIFANLNFLKAPDLDIEINNFYQANLPVLIRYYDFSDKIKIYLGLIRQVLEKNKQIAIIVPTLADIQKIYQYLGDYQSEVSVLLNDLAKNKYWQEWQRIKNGQAKIIIGARSAIFAPFQNLDLIIIDEEDNENHKQEEPNPRYNAKTIALKLHDLLQVKVIFTAITPSLNAMHSVVKKEWQFFEINKPQQKPQIKIIDKQIEFKKGNYSILSEALKNNIAANLSAGKKSFLFLNRKGLATLLTCKDCGYAANCPTCHLPLTYHANKKLICHHCGLDKDVFLTCPNCQSPNLKMTGLGTEKAEIEIKKIFPKAKILKIDIDTPSANENMADIDIFIGTQFAFDYLPWPQIFLVGVLNADTSFALPDYRGLEKTFNILSKLALFLENKDKAMIAQTFSPENYLFSAIKNLDNKLFYQNEISERKILNFPPFSNLIKLIYQSIEFNAGQYEINKIYQDILTKANREEFVINPPLLAYTQQVRGRFRWQIIIKVLNKNANRDFLADLPENIIIDVEPESLI